MRRKEIKNTEKSENNKRITSREKRNNIKYKGKRRFAYPEYAQWNSHK
jgi:hypothetical protein